MAGEAQRPAIANRTGRTCSLLAALINILVYTQDGMSVYPCTYSYIASYIHIAVLIKATQYYISKATGYRDQNIILNQTTVAKIEPA